MSMVTSCPRCHTTFRVKQEELAVSRGRVRCGQCSEIFNAFDALTNLDEAAPETAQPVLPIEDSGRDEVASLERQVSSKLAEASRPLAFTDMAGENMAWQYRHGWLWFAAALLLVLLLAAQVAYNFRAQIAAYYPELRPYLQSYCEYLRCTVGLPRFSELLSIESSDLQADPNHPNLIMLTALLRNRAPFGQAYPELEVTLTDTQDYMLARRVFSASEYLASNTTRDAGMQASSELTLKLYMDSDELKPAGYRLLLFYPRAE